MYFDGNVPEEVIAKYLDAVPEIHRDTFIVS
jgi:hypothetical protein